MANNYRLPVLPTGDAGTGPLISAIDDGTALHQQVRISGGAAPTSTTGSLATSTADVTTGDVGVDNNVTVVLSGTHAGFNVIFEVSPDAGTTWVPIVGSRLDGTGTESSSGVLTANSTRGWEFTLPAVNRFRVRATARTSGTLAVVIAAGAMPLEPVVNAIQSNPPGAQDFSLTPAAAGITVATTSEALVTLVPQRNLTASGTSTTHTVTAGKTLRIFGLSAAFKGVAAASTTCIVYIRAVLTGTATATSPIVAMLALSVPAVVNSAVSDFLSLGNFIELPSGASFAVSAVLTVANAASLLWPVVHGIEY